MSEALGLSPSVRMAGLAADDLIVSAYFLALYALARRVPPEAATTPSLDEWAEDSLAPAGGAWDSTVRTAAAAEDAAGAQQRQWWPTQPGAEAAGQQQPDAQQPEQQPAAVMAAAGAAGAAAAVHAPVEDTRTVTVLHGATALALAAAICFAGTQAAAALKYKGGSITLITAITVTLATLFPRLLAPLRASGEGLAAILMQARCVAAGLDLLGFELGWLWSSGDITSIHCLVSLPHAAVLCIGGRQRLHRRGPAHRALALRLERRGGVQ